MADMKDKKEETIHQEEEAVKAEDVTETAETAKLEKGAEQRVRKVRKHRRLSRHKRVPEKRNLSSIRKKIKRQQPWKKNWQILKTKEFANWQSLKTSASVPRKKSLRCLKWEQRML